MKIVEVQDGEDCKQVLHIENTEVMGETKCGQLVKNRTMIPLRAWHHSDVEYGWCSVCESHLMGGG